MGSDETAGDGVEMTEPVVDDASAKVIRLSDGETFELEGNGKITITGKKRKGCMILVVRAPRSVRVSDPGHTTHS